MIHLDEDGVHWNGSVVFTKNGKHKVDLPDPDEWSKMAVLTEEVRGMQESLITFGATLFKAGELSKKNHDNLKCLVGRVNDNFKLIQDAINDRAKITEQNTRAIADLTKLVNTLSESKLDKPSYSEDLDRAEIYIDDYLETRRRLAADKFARKKRIEKKLERLEEKKQEVEEKQKSNKRWAIMWFISAICAATLGAVMVYT